MSDIVGFDEVRFLNDAGNDSGRTARGEADVIVPAVEMAGEANDLALAGEGPRHAQGEESGLGPGVGEPHSFRRRHQLVDEFGPLDLERMGCSIVDAFGQLGRDGFDYRRVIVAENQRPVPAKIVDVFVPIDVPLARACSALDVHRVRLEVAAHVGDPVAQ